MLYIDAKSLVRAPWFRAGRAAALAGGVLLTTGAQAQLTLLPSGPQIGAFACARQRRADAAREHSDPR